MKRKKDSGLVLEARPELDDLEAAEFSGDPFRLRRFVSGGIPQSHTADEVMLPKATVDWAAIWCLPRGVEQHGEMRIAMDGYVEAAFLKSLPEELRIAFEKGDYKHNRFELLCHFDDTIISLVEWIGPALIMSDAVMDRLIQLHHGLYIKGEPDNCAEQMKRFVNALLQTTLRRSGEIKKGKVGRFAAKEKKTLVGELHAIREKLRVASNLNAGLGWKQLIAAVRENRYTFPMLNSSLTWLEIYCSQHPDTANSFLSGQLGEAGFYDEWGAWMANRSPEKFRQAVSATRRKK